MGRKKGSKNKPKNPEVVATPSDPPKRRGRPPGSKNKVANEDPPQVRTYTQEELAEAYKGTPIGAKLVIEEDVKVEEKEPEAEEEKEPEVEEKPVVPESKSEVEITQTLSPKEIAKHQPLIACVEYLDANSSEQWKLHYDMMAIKERRSRKKQILHFIGTAFGMNTGLLEVLGKELR